MTLFLFSSLASQAEAAGCKAASAGGLSLTPTDCKPVKKARLVNGKAIAPSSAPAAVKKIINAANQIRNKKYIFGGGHTTSRKIQKGYDCSGSVSYALRAAGLIKSPAPSYGYYKWGKAGKGKWVTIYTKNSHMYMVVAGLSFDTSNMSSTGGNRWSTTVRSTAGFKVRSPANAGL